MHQVQIQNQTHPLDQPLMADWGVSFLQRLAGLMFRKALPPTQGLLLVQPVETRLDASIHMFFVATNLAVIWIDNQGKVVDTRLATRWHPYYAPSRPARFVLEIHPSRLDDFCCGDQVSFNHA